MPEELKESYLSLDLKFRICKNTKSTHTHIYIYIYIFTQLYSFFYIFYGYERNLTQISILVHLTAPVEANEYYYVQV